MFVRKGEMFKIKKEENIMGERIEPEEMIRRRKEIVRRTGTGEEQVRRRGG